MLNDHELRPQVPMSFWGQLKHNFAGVTLIVIGVVGATVGLLDIFLELEGIPYLKEASAITLLLVGILAGAVGWERRQTIRETNEEKIRVYEQILQRLSNLNLETQNTNRQVALVHQALVSAVPFRLLQDEQSVYEEIMRIVLLTETTIIKGTTFIISPDMLTSVESMPTTAPSTNSDVTANSRSSEKLYELIAEKIANAARRGITMEYRSVVGYGEEGDDSDPPAPIKRNILLKRQVFSNVRVLSQLQIRYRKTSWPFDVLIAGDSVVLAFATSSTSRRLSLGIRVTDRTFVQSMSQWYDDRIWNPLDGKTLEVKWKPPMPSGGSSGGQGDGTSARHRENGGIVFSPTQS